MAGHGVKSARHQAHADAARSSRTHRSRATSWRNRGSATGSSPSRSR